MIYFSSHKFAFSNLRFFAILRTFSSITREICVQIKNKVHHVNQLIEPDLMMYIHMAFSTPLHPLHSTHSTPPTPPTPLHPLHSTELFKIFFSLLTLSTAFLQKACGPGKNLWSENLIGYMLAVGVWVRVRVSVRVSVMVWFRIWVKRYGLRYGLVYGSGHGLGYGLGYRLGYGLKGIG